MNKLLYIVFFQTFLVFLGNNTNSETHYSKECKSWFTIEDVENKHNLLTDNDFIFDLENKLLRNCAQLVKNRVYFIFNSVISVHTTYTSSLNTLILFEADTSPPLLFIDVFF